MHPTESRIRRGNFNGKKKNIIQEINRRLVLNSFTTAATASTADDDERYRPQQQPWLEKIQKRGTFSVRKGKVQKEFPIPEKYNGLYSVKFSPDGTIIAASFGGGAIVIIDFSTGQLKNVVRNCIEKGGSRNTLSHTFPVMCVKFIPGISTQFLASGACGNIYTCDTEPSNYEIFANENGNEINSIDINGSRSTVVSGGKDAVIKIYDLNTAQEISRLPKDRSQLTDKELHIFHRMRIFTIKFHPNRDNVFLSGGWDDIVKIWDIRTQDKYVREIRGPHICGDAVDVRDNEVLTASWTVNDSLQLWDFGSGKLIDVMSPYNRPRTIGGEFPYCVQYLHGDPTGDTIVSGGSGTDAAEVISLTEKRVLSYFKTNKTIHAVHTYENWLVFGGMDKSISITEFAGRHSEKQNIVAEEFACDPCSSPANEEK